MAFLFLYPLSDARYRVVRLSALMIWRSFPSNPFMVLLNTQSLASRCYRFFCYRFLTPIFDACSIGSAHPVFIVWCPVSGALYWRIFFMFIDWHSLFDVYFLMPVCGLPGTQSLASRGYRFFWYRFLIPVVMVSFFRCSLSGLFPGAWLPGSLPAYCPATMAKYPFTASRMGVRAIFPCLSFTLTEPKKKGQRETVFKER